MQAPHPKLWICHPFLGCIPERFNARADICNADMLLGAGYVNNWRNLLDQSPISRFTFAHRLLRAFTFSDIGHVNDGFVLPRSILIMVDRYEQVNKTAIQSLTAA